MTNTLTQKDEQAARPQAPAPERERERDYAAPKVNIFETSDGYVLEAEMPGVTKDGLTISLEGNVLTLTGHRSDGAVPHAELLYRESRPVDFQRVFELDPTLDTTKISARIDQGILTLALPKAERVKPRKIAVS